MHFFPSSFALLILQCLVPVVQARVNNNPQIRITTTFLAFNSRVMDQWSAGGGKIESIENDSSHPFQGRMSGGGTRIQIRGTTTYGSGYIYNDSITSIAGNGFPFGTWPIYWDQDLLGCDEYGPQLDGMRPGGQLVTIPVRNITSGETYYAIGDRDSIMGIMVSFVTSCNAEPAWPSRFDPTLPNSTIRAENVLQYYRASSFALASLDYNNAFARNSTPSSTVITPFPHTILYSSFYQCLDEVVANALMIVNPPPPKSKPMPLGETLGIAFGLTAFPILGVFYCLWLVCKGLVVNRQSSSRRRAAAIAMRKAGLAYENYP